MKLKLSDKQIERIANKVKAQRKDELLDYLGQSFATLNDGLEKLLTNQEPFEYGLTDLGKEVMDDFREQVQEIYYNWNKYFNDDLDKNGPDWS